MEKKNGQKKNFIINILPVELITKYYETLKIVTLVIITLEKRKEQ